MTEKIVRPIALAAALILVGPAFAAAFATATPTVVIEGGSYQPFFPVAGEEEIELEPFSLDVHQVTNAQFLEFVKSYPEWQRGAVPPIFAGPGYLALWAGPVDLGSVDPNAPVTGVSWFGANAYCEEQGKRLPTEAEWEYVAWADGENRDARQVPGRQSGLMAIYTARPARPTRVAAFEPNAWGVSGLHEQVWEWVADFGGVLTKGDSRNDGDRDLQLYCGGASLGAIDREEYATFMRYAFRSSLQASATSGSLGFRCAS